MIQKLWVQVFQMCAWCAACTYPGTGFRMPINMPITKHTQHRTIYVYIYMYIHHSLSPKHVFHKSGVIQHKHQYTVGMGGGGGLQHVLCCFYCASLQPSCHLNSTGTKTQTLSLYEVADGKTNRSTSGKLI